MIEQVASPLSTSSFDKRLQNSSKRGVNKLIQQFRNLSWVRKLQSPKPGTKRIVDSPGYSIYNPNAHYEADETDCAVLNTSLDGMLCFTRLIVLFSCLFFSLRI